MRTRVTLALFISLLLVLGASWQRAGKEKAVFKISAETAEINANYQVAEPNSVADLGTGEMKEGEDSLTTTDLVGRQLISDYLNLAANGQVSEEDILSLADKYADSIADIKAAPKVTSLDISVVSNSKTNFQKYDLITTEIEKKRIKSMDSVSGNISQINTSDESLNAVAAKISLAYKVAAEELKNIEVPSSLLQLHINLVNNYLSISSGVESILEGQNDTAISFAGIVSARDSLASGERIIEDIVKVLVENGLQN
jgi:hypothetical protein